MAIRHNDDLSDYLGESEINSRFDNWLLGFLSQINHFFSYEKVVGSGDTRKFIASQLRSQSNLDRAMILSERANALVPKSALNWFETSSRFLSFFSALWGHWPSIVETNPMGLSVAERCVLATDLKMIPLGVKSADLERLKSHWLERKDIGRRFEWVGGENEATKAEFVFSEVLRFRQGAILYEPVNSLEALLIFSDRCNLSSHEALSASSEAKRKLSQKKYREKHSAMVQLNVKIDKEVMKRLESIALKYRLSKSDIIRVLIDSEEEKGAYMSEKLAAWMRGDAV
ncbi:MAG TPA: ribbon-helix-helix protein, CopG family [Rhodocyclaceae bacterium]|nr:ribbon-helix-helix protein, CopG family [Rhodocyclaceae bacterium]